MITYTCEYGRREAGEHAGFSATPPRGAARDREGSSRVPRAEDTMSDNGETGVCQFPKGRKSEVRACVREYDGRQLAELRVFTRVTKAVPDDVGYVGRDEWVPTPRGVAVPREQAQELLRAAQAFVAEVDRDAVHDTRDDGHNEA